MKTYVQVLLLCIPISLWAQPAPQPQPVSRYSHGSWLVGLQGGSSPDNLLSHYVTVQPYGGYFVANNLLLGVGGSSIRQYNTSDLQLATYTGGPLVRYQLTRTRFSPFIAASYQIGQQSQLGTPLPLATGLFIGPGNRLVHSRLVKLGINVGLVRALQVDAALCWQDIVSTSDLTIRSRNMVPQFQFGLNYQFGR